MIWGTEGGKYLIIKILEPAWFGWLEKTKGEMCSTPESL
jgi:hypothetical protein